VHYQHSAGRAARGYCNDHGVIAIRCARLFTGERFSAEPATVLLDGEKIIGVESQIVELDESWDVYDYASGTLLPGLIDTHVHLVADNVVGALDRIPELGEQALDDIITESLRRQLAAGVTTVRDLGDYQYAAVTRRDEQRDGRMQRPEPTIVASGPPLTSVAGHCHYLGGEVANPSQISAAIRERIDRSVDVVKVMTSGGMLTPGSDVMRTQFSSDDLRSIVQQAHDGALPVAAHAHGVPAIEQSIEAEVDCIEHFSCLTDQGFAFSDELADRVAERDIAISCVIPPPLDMDLKELPPAIQKLAAATGLTPRQAREQRADMIGRLHARGVRVVVGIDAGLNPRMAHGNLHIGTALLDDAGLSVAQTLVAATSGAARVCGLGHRKGLLREGYDADLIVVEGDLQSDLSALQRVDLVVVAGQPVGFAK
jgi:imidazolonepropionase-like amidohydrolase